MNVDLMKGTLQITKALADLQRVRILMMLKPGELCVCQIVEVLELAASTVSKHLSILDDAGLVDSRKDGRWMYYRLARRGPTLPVEPLLEWLTSALKKDAVIKADGMRLRKATSCPPEVLCQRQKKRT